MADVKIAYQADQTLTNAVASLASSATWVAGYESAWIDNATNLYADYLITGHYTVGTTPTINTEIRIYVVTSTQDGTIYPDQFTGSTGARSVTSEGLRDGFAKLAALIRVDSATSDVDYPFAFNVASHFGGICPREFCLFTVHNTGTPFNSTGGNHVTYYRGVYNTVV